MYMASTLLAMSLVAASSSEESLLTAAHLQTSDKALLDFFRKRTPPAPPRDVLEQAAQKLASANAAEADAAQVELNSLGTCVTPVVREVANRIDDVRAATRAKQVLEMIEGPQADQLPIEAARLLAERKPAPSEITSDPVNWKKMAGAWREWWKGDKNKVVLVDPDPTTTQTLRGFTLLIQMVGSNTVTELGHDGKPRWTLMDLAGPRDAQVLSGGQRVLVAEQNRVTERDLHGKILWQKKVPNPPVSVQRLRNGNTLIACGNQLPEADRAGKEVLKVQLGGGMQAARRLRNGRIIVFSGNQVIQLDKAGRETKRTPVKCGGGGHNEVTDDGHVLALSPADGNLIEFDADGKELHRFDMKGANNAFRLPNGHTLLTLEGQTKCIELDKNWKPVKERTLSDPPLRVRGH
jgi:hypothetical protein